MNEEQIKTIFSNNGLPGYSNIEKVAVGFTNDVYSIDDTYILKICKDPNNENDFAREVVLYEYFKENLPVPEIISYDDSKTIINHPYLLYKKIRGTNLYNVWHTFTTENRQSIVKQLCGLLKVVNKADLETIPKNANLERINSWKDHIIAKINKYLSTIEHTGTLTTEQAKKVREYVDRHSSVLDEQKLALVYWDAHFDNVIVSGDKIVGLIDFERTEVCSIDFTLDIVKRMMDFPKKYMSEYAEQFAKDEDYAELLDWYREYYPDLFDFNDVPIRLNLYEIEHNLEDLENWPRAAELIDRIMQIVD